jgi:hypothetical protein
MTPNERLAMMPDDLKNYEAPRPIMEIALSVSGWVACLALLLFSTVLALST